MRALLRLLLLAVFCVAACTSEPAADCPPGSWLDGDTCVPLGGTLTGRVELAGARESGGVRVVVAGTAHVTWTAADGTWRLGDVRPGPATIEFHASGYLDQKIDGVVVVAHAMLAVKPVTLRRAEVEVHGSVVTSWDGDAPGTRIRLVGTAAEAVAGGDGSFSLVHREAGRFTVRVERPGYTPLDIPDVLLQWGDARDLGDLVLRAETGGLSGKVALADGASPAGTLVYLAGGAQLAAADADGAFALARVVPGAHTLVVMREGYAIAEVPVDVAAAEVSAVGTVRLERRAPEGVGRVDGSVEILGARAHGGVAVRIAGGPGIERTAATAADGSYAFADLPAGVYAISAAHDGLQAAHVEGLVVAAGSVTAPRLTLQASRRVHDAALVQGAALPDGGAVLQLAGPLVRFDPRADELATLLPEGGELVSLHPAGEHAIVQRAGTFFRLDLRDGTTRPIFPAVVRALAAAEGRLLYVNDDPGEVWLADASADGAARILDGGCALRAPLVVEPFDAALPQLVRLTVDSWCDAQAESIAVDMRNATLFSAPVSWELLASGLLLRDADGSVRLYDPDTGADEVLATRVIREWPAGVRYFAHGQQDDGTYSFASLDPATGAHVDVAGVVREVLVGFPARVLLTDASGNVRLLEGATARLAPYCAAARALLTWGRGDTFCLDGAGAVMRLTEAGAISALVPGGASELQSFGDDNAVVTWLQGGRRWARSIVDAGGPHDFGPDAQLVYASADGKRAVVWRPIAAPGGTRYQLALVDFTSTATLQPFFDRAEPALPEECDTSPQGRTTYCLYPDGSAANGRLAVVFDRVDAATHVSDAGPMVAGAIPPIWSADERAALRIFGSSRLALRPTVDGPVVETPAVLADASWAIAVGDGFTRVLVGYPDGGLGLVEPATGNAQMLDGPSSCVADGQHCVVGSEFVDLATGTRTSLGTGHMQVAALQDRSAVVIDEAGTAHWVGATAQPLGTSARIVGSDHDGLLVLVDWDGRKGRLIEVGAGGVVRTIATDVTGKLAEGPLGVQLLGAGLDADGRVELLEVGFEEIRSIAQGVYVGDPIERFRDGWLVDARVDGSDVLVHVADAGGSTVLGARASCIDVADDGALEFVADGVWWTAAPGRVPVAVERMEAGPRKQYVRTDAALLYGRAGGTWRIDLP